MQTEYAECKRNSEGQKNCFDELRALLDAELWDETRALIAAGADINSSTNRWVELYGYYSISTPITLLMYYTIFEGLPQMRFLLSEQADIFLSCDCKCNALMKAAGAGVIEPMRILLEYGAAKAIHQRDIDGRTALLHLDEHGTEEMMQLLLDAGASLSDIDDDGDTLLHWAVMSDNSDLVKGCLRAGIDLYIKDTFFGETALELAITDRQIRMQRLLRVAYRKSKGLC